MPNEPYSGPTETLLQPDEDMISANLESLFGECTEGQISLQHHNPRTGLLNVYKRFDVGDFDLAAEYAAKVNAIPGTTVYFRPAVVPESAPRKITDEDVKFVTSVWVDLDDEGAAKAVKNAYPQDCKPTASVVTGRKPRKRAHLYWKLIEKEVDRAVIKKLNQAAAKKLRGDETAVNPSRLMRLGGSIAWPYKAGREPELTEFKAHKRRHPHAVEKLQRAFEVKSGLNIGPDEETGKKGTPFDEYWKSIVKPKEWHPSALGIVGHLWSDGLSEYGIMKFAPMFKQPGYTLEDTQADLQPLIDHVGLARV